MNARFALIPLALLAACQTPGARTPDADAVSMFVARAEMCHYWSGEEPYDAARRAEIERASRELRCATLVRDGEAMKVSRRERPEDVTRLDAALAPFR